MLGFLDRYTDHTYAILRMITGFLFLQHGLQKLFGFPGTAPPGIPDFVVYIASPIELVGGVLVLIGLVVRPAAFLCSGLMAAGYFMAHLPSGLLPIVNQGELAVMYCFVFLYISVSGAGIWSFDGKRAAS